MSETEELELTRAQRFAGNVTAGAVTVASGIFLLLCGTHAINLPVSKILAASLLFTVGFVLIITGFIQKNTVSLWLSFAFLVPAVIDVLAKFSPLSYGKLYPFYIAIPAIASLVTMLYTREWRAHVMPIFLFGMVALIFSLKSFGLLSWGIVLPLFIVFIGMCIILYAVKLNTNKE